MRIPLLVGLGAVLIACGGSGLASPTPIPADVVRPVQNAPTFPEQVAIPVAPTLTPTPTAIPNALDSGSGQEMPSPTPPPAQEAAPIESDAVAPAPAALNVQRVEALGIVGGYGVSILDLPGGAAIQTLSAGSIINVIGSSEDGAWLAAYTNDRVAGWVAASRVNLYGAEGLAVVNESMTQADAVASEPTATMTPTATPTPEPTATPTSTPTPEPTATPTLTATPSSATVAATTPPSARQVEAIGIVGGSGAALLDTPRGTALQTLAAGTIVNVTGRSEDGAWVTVYTNAKVVGWVDAQRVTLYGGEGLAVVQAGTNPEPSPSTTGGQAVSTLTPTPAGVAPGAPASSTADGGVVAVVQPARLNVRAGPGIDYPVATTVLAGDQLPVLGRNANLTWVRVGMDKVSAGYGWVSAGLVTLSGDVEAIPLSTETSSEPISQVAPAPATGGGAASTSTSTKATASPAGLQGTLVFQTSSGGEIYVYDLATGNLRRLTTGMDPAISPDGNEVAFARGGGDTGVYRIGVDGSREKKLFGGNGIRTPSWSPDGQYVVFSQVTGRVRCYDLGLGGCIPEGEAQNFFSSLPPSQQQQVQDAIADGTIKLIDQEQRGLARVDRDGGAYRDVPALNTAFAPDWNSSGAIVYESNGGLQITADRPDATTDAFTTERGLRDPAWQADYGRIAAHRQEGGHWEIFAINPDGGGLAALTRPARIPAGQSSSVSPAWSPDGKHIVFLSNRVGGIWGLWVMDADGGNQRQLPVTVPLEYRYQGEQMVGWGG